MSKYNYSEFKNRDWVLNGSQNLDGKISLYIPDAQLSVLMDIRSELHQLNKTFNCQNFLNIPAKLDRIARNTAKKRRTK